MAYMHVSALEESPPRSIIWETPAPHRLTYMEFTKHRSPIPTHAVQRGWPTFRLLHRKGRPPRLTQGKPATSKRKRQGN